MVIHLAINTTMKKILIPILLLTVISAEAQDTLSSLSGKLEILPYRQLWIGSSNAAGIAQGYIPEIGQAKVASTLKEGAFRRPQQAGSDRDVSFYSEKYQSLNKLKLYGSFDFRQSWQNNLEWNALLNPYRRMPYILADSVGGEWKRQEYNLKLKAASAALADGKLSVGAGLNYYVGTGARQNDPRPQSYVYDLTFTPSAILKLSDKFNLGYNFIYEAFRENVSYESSNSTDVQKAYWFTNTGYFLDWQMSALGSYSRYYIGKTIGSGLQLSYENEGVEGLVGVRYDRRKETSEDGTSPARPTGRLDENNYSVTGLLRFNKASHTQQIRAEWNSHDGEGIDYHTASGNAETGWIVTNKDVLTTSYYNNASITYSFIRNAANDDFKWMAEAGIAFDGRDIRYLKPQMRQNVDAIEFSVRYVYNLTIPGRKSWKADANFAWRDCFTSYSDFTPQNGVSGIGYNTLHLPDHSWLSADMVKPGLSIQYSQPAKVGSAAELFVRGTAAADIRIGNSLGGPSGNRRYFGISVGAIF